MTETTFDGRVSTRLEPDTAAWLADRADRMHSGSPHVQARTELGLWRTMLAAELRRVRLTLAEASCLADVLNSPMLDPTISGGVGVVYAECYDAFRMARETPLPGESSYAAKWGIDEQRLLDSLSRLGPAADHALRDALSRWWQRGLDSTAQGFGDVGLTVVVDPLAGNAREGS